VKHAIALVTALALGALVPSTSAGAQTGGLSACDYRSSYGDIPCSEVDRAITEAAAEFGVDETAMRRTAKCESTFDPYARNGQYGGLYQQASSYWGDRVGDFNANVDPDVSGGIYNPFDNARVSARMMTQSSSHWPNC
jgi:hypothetical protein